MASVARLEGNAHRWFRIQVTPTLHYCTLVETIAVHTYLFGSGPNLWKKAAFVLSIRYSTGHKYLNQDFAVLRLSPSPQIAYWTQSIVGWTMSDMLQ